MGPDETNSTKQLKVAIVGPSLRYVGGQSVQADLLLRLWQGDPEIRAKFIAVDPPFPTAIRWAEKIRGLRTIIREPAYFWHLWRGLAEVDIVHVFSASYWSFLLAPAPAWLFGRLRRKKILIHYHSGEARDHLQRFRSGKSVLSRVDEVVVPSGYLVDVFHEFGIDARVVANIIDLSQFQYRERTILQPHLVCTRGFSPYYSVDVAVKAFAEVQRRFPNATLDLVGNGPLERDIRKLVSELQLKNVNFSGVASRTEIGRHYDAADIFINASWLDNMPVSVIEAFASGTPVVSTSPEAMTYLVKHERTGLLSPVGDPHALAENVLRLLRDRELASAIARNAYQESKRYSWEAVRHDWLRIYRSLAGNTHATTR